MARVTNRDFAFSKRRIAIEQKFCDNFFKDDVTEKEKLLLVLESCEANIHPYSMNGRTGYKKYLKKAIKILKKINEEDFE